MLAFIKKGRLPHSAFRIPYSACLLLFLAASAPAAVDTSIVPADRSTLWDPGLNAVGGIPNRTTVCATINASTYGNGSQDARAGIQAAIDSCPANQVVQLSAGNFAIRGEALFIGKNIVLRGAGLGATHLIKPAGTNLSVVVLGRRWEGQAGSRNL